MKKLSKILIVLTFLISPISVLAYSSKVIPGGENLGINIKSDGIVILGFYKVNGKYNKGTPELKVGDRIKKIDNELVTNLDDLVNVINKNINNNEIEVEAIRHNKTINTKLNITKIDGIYKTGLYVKDSLTGLGTLTYIDPETKSFGALGHEIIENTTKEKIEVKTGEIFKSLVQSIDKSKIGSPGGKNGKFYYQTVFGNISKNTSFGIYGKYTSKLPEKDLIEIANNDEIKLGNAKFYTVINQDNIEEFSINITKIDTKNTIKNIYFEVDDPTLLDKTGGIVQGMSGSPIIQNNKIIGAVTHVVIDKPTTGYGLFITTMLEEGDK